MLYNHLKNETELHLPNRKYVLDLSNDKNKNGHFLEVCKNIDDGYLYEKIIAYGLLGGFL